MTPSQILALHQQIDAAIDRLGTQFYGEVGSSLRFWHRRVIGLVTSLTTVRVQAVQNTAANRDRVRRGLGDLEAGLLGTKQAVGRNIGHVPELLTYVTRYAPVTNPGQLRTVLDLGRTRLVRVLEKLLYDTSDVIDRAVLSEQLVGEILVEIQEFEDAATNLCRTLYESTCGEYVQQALAQGGQDNPAFLYAGPVDGRCRTFCLAHVGRVWSRPRIDKMNNGQLPNTFLTRGGYNCRHWWVPVEDAALIRLVDTGRALPDVQARLVALARAPKGLKTRRWA